MRLPISLVAILCAVGTGAAMAQTAPSKPHNGISFSYDAQHDQVVANNVQLKATPMTAPTVAPTTGTLVVTINITDVSHFVKGTSYHCAVTAIGGELDTTNGVVSGGIDTAFGIAHWTGSSMLSCAVRIPYSWAILPDPAATRGALLAFGVAAVTPDGAIEHSTLQVDGVEPLPPNGTTSTFTFDVTL
jgi:hypothetical protein